jgi:6-pyruvoyltetrahydropterin/6-carboxytetrahydropterin synthase
MQVQTLKIRHNIEVAHRLSLLPGKCQQIHGHSMWVVAELTGEVNNKGILLGIDFGEAKATFRQHLDFTYDHHLLLNRADPVAESVLPGLCLCEADPTTENIAKWIGGWCSTEFDQNGLYRVRVEVWETQVNSATWEEVFDERAKVDRTVS